MHCYTSLLIGFSYKVNEDHSISYSHSIKVDRTNEQPPMYPLGSPESKELQKLLFIKNNKIPDEICLITSEEALREKLQHEYGQQLEKDMMHHLYPLFQIQMTYPSPKSIVEDINVLYSKIHRTHITFQYHMLMKR